MYDQRLIYFSSGNVFTTLFFFPQKFTVMTITFPPKFPQLPKYQD